MKIRHAGFFGVLGFAVLATAPFLTSAAFADEAIQGKVQPPLSVGKNERLITLLATNDIHGGVEAGLSKDGRPMGGMAYWAGVAQSIRQGLRTRFGKSKVGVLTLDGGDQFQGSLVSNYTEGALMFEAMNEVGYDAAVAGNHDYDFGPIGWLDDQVTEQTADKNPRGAFERAIGVAKFSIISANTFFKDSIVDARGAPVEVNGQECKPLGASSHGGGAAIDWSRAKRPAFLKPWIIKKVAGVRVALIGIDNAHTPIVTTEANVSDLCFDHESAAYLRARQALEGKADVFVVVMHGGDTNTDFEASNFVRALPAGSVDAVVAGHTHFINNARVGGVPLVQSASGGLRFGRVDLIFDTKTRKVLPARTRAYAGIDLVHERCSSWAKDFCSMGATIAGDAGDAESVVAYEGVPVTPSVKIAELVAAARKHVANVADRKLGTAHAEIRVDRTRESPLANALTDSLRLLSKTDVSFMNTGGIRAPIAAGDFTYEQFYKVLPFNNHGLVIGPMAVEGVIALLKRSVQTCGAFGALMQSGLRVTFERDCSRQVAQVDQQAKLLTVSTLAGELLYDSSQGGVVTPVGRTLSVATLDFLAAGGSGFDGFKGTPVVSDLGIVREAMTEYYLAHPASLTDTLDGRWAETAK